MNVLLFGELRENSERLKQIIREDNKLCQCHELESAYELISTFLPHIILLADVSDESRQLSEYVRRQSNGDSITIIVFARPEESGRLILLRNAGVDECILESLQSEERLRIRLAFVKRMAQEKVRRTRSEAELENRIEQEMVLNRLSQQALAHTGATEYYNEMLESLVNATSRSYAILSRKYHDGIKMLATCGLNGEQEEELNHMLAHSRECAAALQSFDPIVIENYENSTWSPPKFYNNAAIKSAIILPLPARQKPQGILALYGTEPQLYTKNEVRFLETASSILSGVIHRIESEAKSKAILDTTIDGIITIDEDGYIESFNRAAEKLFGYNSETVIGQKVNILMPEPYRSEHDSYIENYKCTGERKIIGIGREVTGIRSDGNTFPMYLSVSEMYFNGRQMFTGIVSDISQQRELEQELLQSGEHERRRIGQDLHDGLGQMLSGIGMMTRQLAKSLEKEEHQLAEKAREISEFVKESDEYARQLSRGLMPVDIDSRGLATAFNRLVENARKMFQVECVFHEKNTPVFEDSGTVEHVYRIGQEGVSNAVKHGKASRVDLILDANEEFVKLEVHDDGKGFPKSWRKHAGMGMKIMQFRTRLIGGSLEVFDGQNGGTVLRCTIPAKASRYYLSNE